MPLDNQPIDFESHSMSECDSNDHPVSVVIVVNFFTLFDSQTAAWHSFKFCVDVPWVDPYQFC